jgi:hypothetical protein
MAAHEAAKRAAEVLDFTMADLARELDDALALKQHVTAGPETPPVDRRRTAHRSDDDEWFENRSHLR